MKTFPITDEKYGRTHKSFYYKSMLPNFNWGEKIYMEYDGKLCAAIPLYSAYIYDKTLKGTRNLVCFNIAGHGKKLIKFEVYYSDDRRCIQCSNWQPRVFRSVDDYDRYLKGDANVEYTPDGVYIKDILAVEGYGKNLRDSGTWDKEVFGWYYSHRYEKADKCPMNFKDLWLDEDGAHVTVIHETGWDNDTKEPAFLTREEALESSRKSVVEFDDEIEVEQEQEWTVSLPKDVAVKAKTLEEAEAKVKGVLNQIVNA